MTRIKIHISNVKLSFYPPCEVKCGLQNRVSTCACHCLSYHVDRRDITHSSCSVVAPTPGCVG